LDQFHDPVHGTAAFVKVPGLGCDGDQSLGGGLQQQVIDDHLVLIGDVGDRPRQGEDDVEIEPRARRGFGLVVGQPLWQAAAWHLGQRRLRWEL